MTRRGLLPLSALLISVLPIGCGPTDASSPPQPPAAGEAADLTVTGLALTTHSPAGPQDQVSICLNQQPTGQEQIIPPGQEAPDAAPDAGPDYIDVRNQGSAAAGPYRLLFGVHHLATGQDFGCGWGPLLHGTAAGQASRYAGPYCCTFDARILPLGAFRYMAIADSDHQVPAAPGPAGPPVRRLLSQTGFTLAAGSPAL